MSRYGDAYSACAIFCASYISWLAKKHKYKSVALVYEARSKNDIFIEQEINEWINDISVDSRIDSIDFLRKELPQAIPLHAADFLAHTIGTNEIEWIKKFSDTKRLTCIEITAEKLKEASKKINYIIPRQHKLRRAFRYRTIPSRN
jgi:hypothetical protein